MKRREVLLAFALAGVPFAHAQERVRRVGVLLPAALNAGLMGPLRKRLAELGWVEGKNLAFELRNAENRYDRLPALAADLVRLEVDLIVAASTPVARAAKDASSKIPVVFTWVADPVGSGLVASLGRPGSNATGLSNRATEVAPKSLELIKTLIPDLKRVAELRDPNFAGTPAMSAQLKAAAPRLGITLIQVGASAADELEPAFAAAAREKVQAMLVPPLPLYGEQRKLIAELGKKYRIATASQFRSFVEAGGLVSYGSDLNDGFVRTATYVDRILRGAKPADLPVEQSDRFVITLNRRTAAELGLKIPQDLLLRADEVFE